MATLEVLRFYLHTLASLLIALAALIGHMMPNFSQLPNAFAWQHEGRWYYAEDHTLAPDQAVEMLQVHDGQEVFLSYCRGNKGGFIRGAKRLDEPLPP